MGTLRFTCLYALRLSTDMGQHKPPVTLKLVTMHSDILRRGVELDVYNKHSALIFSNPCHIVTTVILYVSA